MHSILTTPPTAEPITLAEAKAHLRITHADEDQLISRLIIAARRLVEGHTGLKLMSQGWSIFLDDWPGQDISLPIAPLISLNDVITYGDDDVPATVDPAHYYAVLGSRPPRLVLRGSRAWPRPGRIANGIEIKLTAGFGASAAAVPEALREAMLHALAQWYGERGDSADQGLPLAATSLIAPYRELRL
ncbi:MAG: head-tail connector protein [Aestuariivirga sp.]